MLQHSGLGGKSDSIVDMVVYVEMVGDIDHDDAVE